MRHSRVAVKWRAPLAVERARLTFPGRCVVRAVSVSPHRLDVSVTGDLHTNASREDGRATIRVPGARRPVPSAAVIYTSGEQLPVAPQPLSAAGLAAYLLGWSGQHVAASRARREGKPARAFISQTHTSAAGLREVTECSLSAGELPEDVGYVFRQHRDSMNIYFNLSSFLLTQSENVTIDMAELRLYRVSRDKQRRRQVRRRAVTRQPPTRPLEPALRATVTLRFCMFYSKCNVHCA